MDQSQNWIGKDLVSYDEFGSEFNDENLFQYFGPDSVAEGLILIENQSEISRNGYKADENIDALYAMAEIPVGLGRNKALHNLRLIIGARYENYILDVMPYNPVTKTNTEEYAADIDQEDVLPSVNLIFPPPGNNYQPFLLFNNRCPWRISRSGTVCLPGFLRQRDHYRQFEAKNIKD